jgi:hypothetical protein
MTPTTAFGPYIRPHTSIVLKAGCMQGVNRDVPGEVIPYEDLSVEQTKLAWADGVAIQTKMGLVCFSRQVFDQLTLKNLIKVYS